MILEKLSISVAGDFTVYINKKGDDLFISSQPTPYEGQDVEFSAGQIDALIEALEWLRDELARPVTEGSS